MSKKPAAPIVEPSPIPGVLVDELSIITNNETLTHLIFSVRQPNSWDGSTERVVQARLVVPTDKVQAIARALLMGQANVVPVDANGEPVELH